MATTPSSFFFPTTAPAYAQTTVFPPPPFGFGAPEYGHHIVPSDTTYPPPPYPGGYYAPFPYAATYPYQPPASSYTPAPGFSPNWPSWPPPSPDPTTTTTPPTFCSFPTPTFGAPTTIPTLHDLTAPLATDSSLPAYHASSPPKEVGRYTAGASRPHAAARTPRHRRSHPHADGARTHADGLAPARAVPLHSVRQEGHGPLQVVQEQHEAIPQDGDPAAATSEKHATDSTSAPRLRPHHGLLDDFFDCIPEVTASVPSMPSNSATASVALEMFGEMPQSYGFHNLNRQRIIRADGTEHSYFSLPADYSLKQVTPPMSSSEVEKVCAMAPPPVAAHASGLAPVFCSKANSTAGSDSLLVRDLQLPMIVQDVSSVFKEMPVYDVYEDDNSCLNCMDEQLATPFHKASENELSEQLLTCFSKALETEQRSACLNIVTDVLDVTLELQQHDGEKASNCPVQKELRLQWDPGENTTLRESRWNVLITQETRKEWDPGDAKLTVLFTTAAVATKLQCMDAYKYAIVQILDVQFGSTGAPILESAIMHSYMTLSKSVDLQHFWAQLLLVSALVHYTECFLQGTALLPDNCFGLHSSELVKQLVCYTSISSSTAMSILTATTLHMKLILCYGKVALEEKNVATMYQVLRIQSRVSKTSHTWDPGIVFILSELWWLSKGTNYALRRLLAVKFGTHNYTYFLDTAANMCCSPANLIQQRGNIAALHQFWQFKLQSTSVGIWDPGIAISLYMYSWLEMAAVKTSLCLQRPLLNYLQCQIPMSYTSCSEDKFVQQGVQKLYAKNLLSSQNYLQIWEMDIMFITFLPP